MNPIRLFPREASTAAPYTDAIFFGLMGISAAVVILVATLIVVFCVRYRRGTKVARGPLAKLLSREVEIGWTLATFLVFVAIFGWAAAQDFTQLAPTPPGSLEIHVLAKQWMWKTQHPGGQSEIDALHLPAHQPVRLILNSQDVIHSFYVPAFRVKMDVVPGHTEELHFEATTPGTYRLYCSEFCGTDHSHMLGDIVVMEPQDYARWLAAQPQGDTLARHGEALFREYGCSGCHTPGSRVHAPSLAGLWGRPVALADGRMVVADEAYIRDCILVPNKNRVAGYPPLMPSFAGRVEEGDLVGLVAYIRSLADTGARP
jgi:cytochrome c oxidase subunit 2